MRWPWQAAARREEGGGHDLAAFRQDCSDWALSWGRPGLEERVALRYSDRLEVALGRCTPARRSIRLHAGLRHGPRELLREVICHELAHIAAWELHGEDIRPHGKEWQDLLARAGYRPSTRLQVPDGLLPRPRRRRRRRRYLYKHLCPSCRWERVARAAVRRWRCPRCTDGGAAGELEIWRIALP